MVDRRVGALQGERRWEGSRERVSAPGSESIALGHALVCPGVSLGGDKLGGLPAWGPLGLNLLSGCRVCVQSYQQRSVSAQERHTHTHTRVYTSDTYAEQLHIGASMLWTSCWRWEGQPEEVLEGEAAFGMPRRKAAEDEEEEEEKKSTARGGGA